jgi:hypothetical protein
VGSSFAAATEEQGKMVARKGIVAATEERGKMGVEKGTVAASWGRKWERTTA